jgi:hypothetical protein
MQLVIANSHIFRKLAPALLFAFLVCPFLNPAEPVKAQTRKNAKSFEGKWVWQNFLSKSDPYVVPEGFDRNKDPFEMLTLEITQKGDKLSGEYNSAIHFAGRTDEGPFIAVVKGSTAEFEIESGHGATVTVRLTLERGQLSWRIMKVDSSKGDYWLPKKVRLRRIKTHRLSS